VQSVETVCETLADSVINSGMTALFSLMFILQIYIFAPSLFDISICIMISHMVFSVICGILQTKVKRKQVKYSDKEQGISYALISGIQKIKLAGAEKRAFSKWANAYAKTASAMYNPPFILKAKNAVSAAIALVGGICIYYVAAKNNVGVADYYAFNSAYAIASVAFFSFIEIAVAAAEIKSKIEDINLFFESEPEISSEKQVLTKISGGIELCNVSFRYADEMPDVIDNISLKISPGQYVAIVGKTGCGKSTLMRLMLGLEKARKGVIYYDNKDIEKIDLKSLRQKIGVVMQDGKLFHGDILSNITIASPNIPAEKVWEAAEIAGIADDIKKMPMGIKTIVSEGSRGISGGQKQRILIARAIASNPKILMFDEATSALDNITQKKIADSLEGLNCTRIVIAHRLSTIKQCNRIIVLDKGKIAEDGTYQELMQKNGLFAELVSRQKIE
jgi:ABC-type bacteriocin/lantibiotic exporter with double-glycine peptidase domain